MPKSKNTTCYKCGTSEDLMRRRNGSAVDVCSTCYFSRRRKKQPSLRPERTVGNVTYVGASKPIRKKTYTRMSAEQRAGAIDRALDRVKREPITLEQALKDEGVI